jgi:exodeoxyribonuclease V alpha subunit
VNAGDSRAVFEICDDPSASRVKWLEIDSADALHRSLANRVVGGYRNYLTAKDPRTAIERFDSFKILCAVKFGPFGVEAVNGFARRVLAGSGLVPAPRADRGPWYPGRPVLVTRNDYGLELFNGDMGITLPASEGGPEELFVFFPGPAGRPRQFATYQLPAHETVFALTVHKSQGSEFDDVLIVLPDRDAPVLTRELIYTGVTRARHSVVICGKREILEKSLARTIDRTSGLRDRLWKKEK